MLEKIISGGQSGADRAGWRAAKAFGVSSGGWMPRGLVAEEGPHPEFADEYGATELTANSVRDRTEQNVLAADATLWFGVTTTLHAQATVGACHRFAKPCMPVYPGASFEPCQVATWIAEHKIGTLNVAGNREDEEPGIGWNASSASSCNSSDTNGPDPAATIAAHGKTRHLAA
jgi:Circularly permutated YpsA SLOG family